MKELIAVYEPEQIDAVVLYATKAADARVLPLDYWIEQELIKRGVPVLPFSEYCKPWTASLDIVRRAQTLSRQWHRLPELSFFQHAGLHLGEMFEAVLMIYLQGIQSYLLLFTRILDRHPDIERLVVPHSTVRIGPTAGPFASYHARVVADAGRFCAQQRGISFVSIGNSQAVSIELFPKQPLVRTFLLRAYNWGIGIAPRRPLRLFVSDHWRNLKSIIERMDDSEVVFVDRKELRNIPLRQLWKHRVRFLHPLDVATSHIRSIARARQKEFRDAWPAAKDAIACLPDFSRDGFNWWSVVEPMFGTLVASYAERVIADIESTRSILQKEKSNRVLVRASISGQHHFFIMGELPHQFGIPSFEIQHGIGVGILDPQSAFGHLHADYLAAYGPLVQQALVRNGYAAERIRPTGSPRFDRYYSERDALTSEARNEKVIALGLDPRRPVICVVMPAESEFMLGSTDLSSYEYQGFIRSLADIKKTIPEIQFILKFRSSGLCEKYRASIRTVLPSDALLEHGDAFPLVLLSDFVYACFSTLVSECIMARKPVILFPLKKGDSYFYEAHKDGVLSVPLLDESSGIPTKEVIDVTQRLINDTTFYADAVQKGQTYLSRNFTFTGRATQEVAECLRSVSAPPKR